MTPFNNHPIQYSCYEVNKEGPITIIRSFRKTATLETVHVPQIPEASQIRSSVLAALHIMAEPTRQPHIVQIFTAFFNK